MSYIHLDAKVKLIRSLLPLGQMHVQELLDQEVEVPAGEKYVRKEASYRGRRYGSNPGTVRLAGQRLAIRVPRVRSVEGWRDSLALLQRTARGGA